MLFGKNIGYRAVKKYAPRLKTHKAGGVQGREVDIVHDGDHARARPTA